MERRTLYPLNARGFIDEDEVFKMVIGTLKMPLSYLEELTPCEITLLVENYNERQMEHYQLISTAFTYGYISAKKGKKIEMFKKQNEQKVQKISQEKKELDKEFLQSVFAKDK